MGTLISMAYLLLQLVNIRMMERVLLCAGLRDAVLLLLARLQGRLAAAVRLLRLLLHQRFDSDCTASAQQIHRPSS